MSQHHNKNALSVSFEFFPPKNAEMNAVLWDSVQKLAPLGPQFASVTYGAGGTTQDKTLETLERFSADYAPCFPAAGHLTCVGKSKDDVDAVARQYKERGIKRIVALRGDAPVGQDTFIPHPDGYEGAAELVKGLKKIDDFHISVAAYPEKHPESRSLDADLDHLKRKIDAGADQAITQFFFDNQAYLRFIDRAQTAGITIPILPGILPIMNFQTMKSFAGKCGTSIPPRLESLFQGLDKEPAVRHMIATSIAVDQCQELVGQGVTHFHFYTLNRFELTCAITRLLGLSEKMISPEKAL